MTDTQFDNETEPVLPEIADLPTVADITGIIDLPEIVPVEEPEAVSAGTDKVLRNIPAQGRSQTRVEHIKDAARDHYAAVGRDRFNTGDVATLAGCSIGTVYRYFVDRVALMDAIHPDRDDASGAVVKLSAISQLEGMEGTVEEKWASVKHILAQP